MLSACNQKKVKKIRLDEFIVEGDIKFIGKDTLFADTIKYFNEEGKLVFKSNYVNNKLEGLSLEFYPNGIIKSEASYLSNELHGIAKNYDSMGNLVNSANFFHGLQAGGQMDYIGQFDSLYTFSSLESYRLYNSEYQNDSTCIEDGHTLNYSVSPVNENGTMKYQVFVYVVEPPHKKLTYKIFDKNLVSGDSTLLAESSGGDNFFFIVKLSEPKKGHKYFFSVSAYYPIQNKTIENIIEEDKREIILR